MNLKLIAAGAFAIGILAAVWWIDGTAYDRGYNSRVAEEAALIQEKSNAANRADDAARRCAADPTCRLSDDIYRRD